LGGQYATIEIVIPCESGPPKFLELNQRTEFKDEYACELVQAKERQKFEQGNHQAFGRLGDISGI